MSDNKKKFMVIYHISERKDDSGKKFWNRIGTAWVNGDGSINLDIETFPLDGKNVQLRHYTPKEDNGNAGGFGE